MMTSAQIEQGDCIGYYLGFDFIERRYIQNSREIFLNLASITQVEQMWRSQRFTSSTQYCSMIPNLFLPA